MGFCDGSFGLPSVSGPDIEADSGIIISPTFSIQDFSYPESGCWHQITRAQVDICLAASNSALFEGNER